MPKAHNTRVKPVKPSPGGSTDLIEQQAATLARTRGKPRTSDADRKAAYHDMKKTAPKVSEKKSPAH